MGTRTIAQVEPTDATIALNAYIFGYAGHSLVTPHAALKQCWWTDDRIDAKVTRRFVVSKLRGAEREFLNKPLAFGEGLTDDTYMDWILGRARRLFLILSVIGVPDRIFGAIDDSWQDEDLPIDREDVRKLELAIDNDEGLNQKFYDSQFVYLLRQLQSGAHIDYGPREHIPMDYVHKLPPAVCLQVWDKIHFPNEPNDIFQRRKFSVGPQDSANATRPRFFTDMQKQKSLAHEHIAPIWASYTSDQAAYILSPFVGEHTLKTFMDHRMPPQFQRIGESNRPVLLVEWMHCLADTIASLHHRGSYNGAVRPSNILVNKDNKLAFSDIGHLQSFQSSKRTNKQEVTDYAAPEVLNMKDSKVKVLVATSSNVLNQDPKLQSPSWGSPSSDCESFTFPSPPTFNRTSPSSPDPSRNFSRHLTISLRSQTASPIMPSSPTFSPLSPQSLRSPQSDPGSYFSKTPDLCNLPVSTPQAADIFSLGCVYLDLLTFMVKGRLNEFVKFRTVRSKIIDESGSTKSVLDTSFHDSSRIDAWISILRTAAFAFDDHVYRGVPALLELARSMLVQNAEHRPSAQVVRDRIEDILARECAIEALCCSGREWEVFDESKLSPNHRDSISVATGGTWASARSGSSSEATGSTSPLSRWDSRGGTGGGGGQAAKKNGFVFPWKRGPALKMP